MIPQAYILYCLGGGFIVLLFIALMLDLRKYFQSGFDPHPYHFFYAALFLVAASAVHRIGDDSLYWGFIGLAVALVGWMVTLSIKEAWTNSRKADTEYLKAYHRMSPDERAELGYMPSKDSVRVETVRHNAITGAYEGESHDWIPTSPAKLRLFAQGYLEGAPLTFGKWAGKGKLFTDPEYELVSKKLLELGFTRFKNGKTSDNGYERTDEGIAFFMDYLGLNKPDEQTEEEAEKLVEHVIE